MAEQELEHPEIEENTDTQADEADDSVESADEPMVAGEVVEDAPEPTLEEVIAQLQIDAAQAKDAALRAQADAQNIQRRAEQDMGKARKFALEQFCKDLLPVIDNLERALEAAPSDVEAVKPIAEGVELTLKSFFEVLKKFKVDVVDPVGEPFDPQFHQAMSMVENADVEPNTVTLVMQKGYTLNGRLVRPAMVMISKAPV